MMKSMSRSRSKDASWRRVQVVTALLVGFFGLVGCGYQGPHGDPLGGTRSLAKELKISTSQLEYWKPGNQR
ncbi:MAG: hypothetical protein CMJ29_07510 [Phycisphaerae bacterium]|nr:hypothetical protein [Phycisphaerae bacterium]MAT81475.1 hypothetical protein [Phycisphaerae bacterium]